MTMRKRLIITYLIKHLFLYSQNGNFKFFLLFLTYSIKSHQKSRQFCANARDWRLLCALNLNSVRLMATGLKRKVPYLLDAYDSSK